MPPKTKAKKKTSGQAVGKAFAHPVRGEALTILTERTASPSQLAKELGQDVRYISYHVDKLREWRLIRLVKTEPRRGAIEHFYRATTRTLIDRGPWERLPKPLKEDGTGQVMQGVLEDFAASAKAGVLVERPDIYLGRTLLDLDQQGWEEASELVNRVAAELLDVQSNSANRIAEGEESIKASASMLFFELPANRKSG